MTFVAPILNKIVATPRKIKHPLRTPRKAEPTAAAVPEVEFDMPEAPYEPAESIRAQIEDLSVGQSYSKARRFDTDELTKSLLIDESRKMRLALQPTVYRITKRTGQQYTIEGGEFRTLSHDVVICLVVTRID